MSSSEGGKEKDGVPDLLFNLASADRLALLSEVAAKVQTQASLAKRIDASLAECSRHLARLRDAGLVRKNSDGLYQITTIGSAMLKVLPSLEFLLEHKDRLLSHDLSDLPRPFVERIGELSGGRRVDHFSQAWTTMQSVMSGAKEFVWGISDQPLVPGISFGQYLTSRDVSMRIISNQKIELAGFKKANPLLPERFELGRLHEVRVGLAMNESIAWVCFAGAGGELDHSTGFAGTDTEFRGWCADLFGYYWEKATKVRIT